MAKVTKFCSLLHSTCGLKEAFEGQYGANRSIPSAVSTRWNSTLRLVEAVTDLDPQSLNTLLEAQGHKGLCLSAREWSQLKELVEILAPFLQATDLTQGEKVVTLSAALPCVLSLNSHLNSMLNTTRHLAGFVKALQKSLQRRFRGIFANVRMDDSDSAQPAGDLPFGDMVYMMSALLDPSFCFFWLEQDVLAPDEVKSEVKEMIMDLVLAEARKVTILAESCSGEDNKDEEPPDKTPRLFTGYRKKSKKKDDHVSSVKAELIRYIQVCSGEEDEADCLVFWKRNAKVFPRLYLVAMRVLAVPATSAPVERVFSHGGLIMRPHRARLSARTLSSLIFLKCNHSDA
ncbi:hypothetical protein JOQ06_029781 [Pogonophryne albipinna]|uniref:HAT C-terminal dimerisation domain-containing protein n=1 Tax=Pogonophryne albipinna TaxID=1090488 RepID=A0AAD6AWY5_9TELE|nr:hypothetical protein JOQ06_029781 [Pogonophryne albipinna]